MESPIPSTHVRTTATGGVNRQHLTRRRRVPHRVPCRLRVFNAAIEPVATYCGQTVNISAGGLAVQVGEAIPEGTIIEALVPHLEGEPLRIGGKVLHSRRVLGEMFEIGIGAVDEQTTHRAWQAAASVL